MLIDSRMPLPVIKLSLAARTSITLQFSLFLQRCEESDGNLHRF